MINFWHYFSVKIGLNPVRYKKIQRKNLIEIWKKNSHAGYRKSISTHGFWKKTSDMKKYIQSQNLGQGIEIGN